MTEEHTPEMPPIKIAFVLDGKVADVLHTDERLASIFLSEPTIVDATDFIANNQNVNLVDAIWDGTTFIGKSQEDQTIVE